MRHSSYSGSYEELRSFSLATIVASRPVAALLRICRFLQDLDEQFHSLSKADLDDTLNFDCHSEVMMAGGIHSAEQS
jgi:hypothetical protein